MKITTEEELDTALEEVAKLLDDSARLNDKIEKLAIAIEEYEDIYYPMDKPSLWARIKFRLGQRFGWLGW